MMVQQMAIDKEAEEGVNYKYLMILLGMASVVLAAATIYMMQVLAASYGTDYGIGSLISSGTFNGVLSQENLTVLAAQASLNMNGLHEAMREVYVIFLLSLGMLGASFVLYTTRKIKYSSIVKKYTLLHSTLTVLYVVLFYLVFSSGFNIDLDRPYFLLVYGRKLLRKEIRMDAGTPYTNLVKLREGVFSGLSGNVEIVDKHFNSQAISNLHRLVEGNLEKVKRIDVLTTKEMFDSRFLENYNDFKKELSNAGVELNFMLMADADSVNQHEGREEQVRGAVEERDEVRELSGQAGEGA